MSRFLLWVLVKEGVQFVKSMEPCNHNMKILWMVKILKEFSFSDQEVGIRLVA